MEKEIEKLRRELHEWCLLMDCRKCPYRGKRFCSEGDFTLAKLQKWRAAADEILADGIKVNKPDKEKFKKTAYDYEKYNLRKEMRICVKCGSRSAEGGRVTCKECRERINQYYRERRNDHG